MVRATRLLLQSTFIFDMSGIAATITSKLATQLKSEYPTGHEGIKFPTTNYKPDPVNKMCAIEFHGNKDMRTVIRPRPMITDPTDAVIRVTTSTVCGSDLHLYHNEMMGLEKHDILGHECVGIVTEIGPEVKNVKVGDRVAISFDIACGQCMFCQKGQFTLCRCTNPSTPMDKLYGQRIGGAFGYTHLLGGYEGAQAEFVRVPIADVNLLKIPDSLPDEKAILLSDIACTGWHANELGEVGPGSIVAVWGCGPVGLMAIMWAKFRGASRVIAIDNVPYRLKVAQEVLGAEIINFSEKDVVATIHEMEPLGPDVCIEAVGFRYAKSLIHKAERAVRVESDTPEILTECIKACRKGGIVSIVGDYYSMTNQFPIGALMEKGLTMRGSQAFVQKYWKQLLQYFVNGDVDPSFVITHQVPLEQAPEAYRIFDLKQDNAIKILFKTGLERK